MEFLQFVAALLAILLIFSYWRFSYSRPMPPGPFCWPLIGCIFSLKQPLHLCFRNFSKKYGPILHFKVGMLSLVVVNSPDVAKEVLKIRDIEYANRPPTKFLETYSSCFKGILSAPCGDHFSTMRKLAISHLFSTVKLNATSPIREAELRSIVRSIKKFSAVDLRDCLCKLNSNIVFGLVFGIKPANTTKVLRVLDEINGSTLNFNIGEFFPGLDWLDLHGIYKRMSTELLPQMNSILVNIIQESRKQRQESNEVNEQDLIDVLMSLQENGSLSLSAVLCLLTDIISAGIETSQGVTEWTMAEVMNNPIIMKKAQLEIDNLVGRRRLVQESDIVELPYVQAIAKEALRLHPPAPLGIPHYNLKESTLAGYRIPAKSQVLVNLWAIGRDPAYWEDPELFNPERFLGSNVNVTGQHFQLLPFSSGRRICTGYPLAVRSIPTVIATLLHAFDWERIGTDSLEEATGTVTCRLSHKVEAHAHPRLEESAYVL